MLTKNIKLLRIIILSKGIILLLLGIVHIIVTFTYEYNAVKDTIPVKNLNDYLVWFMAVGIFIIFIGVHDIISYYELKFKLSGIWKMTFCTSVFTIILGGSGTLYFREGPPIIILLLGIVSIVPIFFQRKEFSL